MYGGSNRSDGGLARSDDSITGIVVVDLLERVNSFVNKAGNFLLEVHQEVVDHLVESGPDNNHLYFTPSTCGVLSPQLGSSGALGLLR